MRVAALAVVLCGCSAAAVPALPPAALPGTAGPLGDLDAETVSADAVDPIELISVLDRAGFVAGRERRWTDEERSWEAVARVLAFETPSGAEAYLDWLRANVTDVIGRSRELPPFDMSSPGLLALHEPGGCCPKEGRIYLAAWRKGSTVLSIQVGGRNPQRRDVQELASALDSVA